MTHPFTQTMLSVLERHFGTNGQTVFDVSPLLQYLNRKTRSANRGSKSRGNFGSLYAIYVLTEDYLKGGYHQSGNYAHYEGADFTPLLRRMQELPFGQKLQNHCLNNRPNDEFHKFFPNEDRRPILREVKLQKYWVNESLLLVEISGRKLNIAKAVIEIIDEYIRIKRQSFEQFIRDCGDLKQAAGKSEAAVAAFIRRLIAPERDARIFEIVSYGVLRAHFAEEIVFIGLTRDDVKPEALRLYKTGRTSANDGGIDFVMRPLGRFFQVTETLDVKKYFLDIDKIERYPISFVVKTNLPVAEVRTKLEQGAREQYVVDAVVLKYMAAIEEIINVPRLLEIFDGLAARGRVREVLDEIVRWSKVEFNYFPGGNSQVSGGDEHKDDE